MAKRQKLECPGYPEVKLLGEYGDVPWGQWTGLVYCT